MSGWTCLTFEFEDGERAEEVDAELREHYQGRQPPTAEGYADCSIQLERGINRAGAARKWAGEYPDANRIIVVQANDTSDCGDGALFDVDSDGNVREIETKEGYEGALGNDVTGYFRDEYSIKGYSSWEA